MGVIPEHVDSPTTQAGAEAGAVGRRWYGRRPLLGAPLSPLVYEAEPAEEKSWWLHAEIWEIWVWHQCRPVAEDPGLADGRSHRGGQMAVAARRL